MGVTAYLLSDEVTAFSRRLPTIVRDIRAAVQSASPRQGLLRQLQQAVSELESTTGATGAGRRDARSRSSNRSTCSAACCSGARSIGGYLGQGLMMLFLIYFLLASGEMFKQKLVKLSSQRLSQRKITLQMIEEINPKIGRFVFYQAWSGLLVGVADVAGLHLAWRALCRTVGRGGGRAELRAVCRSDLDPRRVGAGRADSVQDARHGGAGQRRVGRDHRPRRVSARAA